MPFHKKHIFTMYNYVLKFFCLQFLQMALGSCLSELQVASGTPEEGLSLPWVHLAYQHFRTRLQNFSRILTIHPQVLSSLSQAAEKHNLAGCEMVCVPLGKATCAALSESSRFHPGRGGLKEPCPK